MSDIEIGSVWRNKTHKSWTVIVISISPSADFLQYATVTGNRVVSTCDTSWFLDYYELHDMVNHPPHYKDESGVECCQVTDLMMFNAASCFKYLYRCGNKWDDIEDLKKAVWYAKRSYLTGDNEQPNSLEWDNNVKAIASYREGGIYKAMTAIRSYNWVAVAAFIENEIARLESEAADD